MEIKTGSPYSIGIRKRQGGYEAAADWWAVETFSGQKQEQFLERLMRRYAYHLIMDKTRGMGFFTVSEEEDARANLRICVRRWTSV
jgi:hypothetical protein